MTGLSPGASDRARTDAAYHFPPRADDDDSTHRVTWPEGLDPLCLPARAYVRRIDGDGGGGYWQTVPQFVAQHLPECDRCQRYRRRRARSLIFHRLLGLMALLALTIITTTAPVV